MCRATKKASLSLDAVSKLVTGLGAKPYYAIGSLVVAKLSSGRRKLSGMGESVT